MKEEMVRSTHEGTTMENEIGIKEMTNWVTLPRDFYQKLFKKYFNKDIEMP
jgi:hypothetical protein